MQNPFTPAAIVRMKSWYDIVGVSSFTRYVEERLSSGTSREAGGLADRAVRGGGLLRGRGGDRGLDGGRRDRRGGPLGPLDETMAARRARRRAGGRGLPALRALESGGSRGGRRAPEGFP